MVFWATHCRIPEIVEAAKTIKTHWAGILRWFESKVSNGILEGLNRLVQAANRRQEDTAWQARLPKGWFTRFKLEKEPLFKFMTFGKAATTKKTQRWFS
jgi:hypothetical protein